MNKEIIWKNEKWIVDYKTGTIHRKSVHKIVLVSNIHDMQEENNHFPFKEYNGVIYFKDLISSYMIVNGEVVSLTTKSVDYDSRLTDEYNIKMNEDVLELPKTESGFLKIR